MSRLYDTVEPSVINDDMLQAAVEEQGPKEEGSAIAKGEGIEFSHVRQLRLDFKNILKIDNLWCFTGLVKLQLDNNIIERIQGLDVLVNLVWLDLSFNNIEVIEGLDRLTKIKDLTLYNNRIQRLENMDSLKELHVFSIGNNDLNDLENIKYLRQFKQLQTINLSGNPICQLDEYKLFVLGYLPQLEYLDYRLVDKSLRAVACEKYEISIQQIQSDEKLNEAKLEEQQHKNKEHQLHVDAYVENLDGAQLIDSIFVDDTDGKKLQKIPGIDEIFIPFREKFLEVSHQMFEVGLQKHEERRVEIEDFLASIEDAKLENRQQAAVKLNEFTEYKEKLWQDLNESVDQGFKENARTEYFPKVNELWDVLMGLEMQLADQIDDTVGTFERNISELVAALLESMRALTVQLRDLENAYNEKLLELGMATLEKVNKGELEDDVIDELRDIFVDKDTVTGAVASSHDMHLLKIDNREEDIVKKIQLWQRKLIDETHDREVVKRNRLRVIEINHLTDHLREEMDDLDFEGPD